MAQRLNPGELQIDLFCKGIKIDPGCTIDSDGRHLTRTRAGLGSGLELVIPGDLKDLWMNAPVEEDFVYDTPFHLMKSGDGYVVRDERTGFEYEVRIPSEPAWYTRKTSKGTPMHKLGVLQGTYLGIYISNSCAFWYHSPSLGCKFCTTGLNVGVNESAEKDLDEIVELAQAAKEESGVTFVHFNSGYDGKDRGLDIAAPYIKAMKERVGVLTGLQVTPSPNLWKYDWLRDCGVDHFSFCYEFQNPKFFADLLPGKEKLIGQRTFFDAMEYTSKLLGKGRVSGEIIAGVEPIEDTLQAIDYITGVGAWPTVCIFRPTIGAEMERYPSPAYEDMRRVMEYMWDSCRRAGLPIGATPGIEVSLIVSPDDARYLPKRDMKWRMYELKLATMRNLAKPIFARELRPHAVKGDPTRHPEGSPDPIQPRTTEAEAMAKAAGLR